MVARHAAVPIADGGPYQIRPSASVSSSQINEHSYKANFSETTLTPLRSWTMSNHNRTFSIVSAQTDFELCAIAELLSPAVSHTRSVAEEQETTGVALDDGLDDYLDASIKPSDRRQGKPFITPYLLQECEEPLSPPHPSYSPASCTLTPSDSEFESSPEDNYWHPHTSSQSAIPAFHLPRRIRARTQSSAGVSASDSDTPSLSSSTTSVSSSQSRSYSPPRSPATLKTPVDHVPPSHPLAIIEERSMGEQIPIDRRVSQGSGSIVFAPTERLSGQDRLVPPLRTIDARTKNRNIENLRVNVPPPFAPFPILIHSPSPTLDTSASMTVSRTMLPNPRSNMSGKLSLTRIISPVSKTSKSSECGSELLSPSTSVSTSALKLTKDTKEEKTRKAEAKRMKKAEQKAKVERLAEELKERQRRKALAKDRGSIHSNRSGVGRGRRHWDDDIAMYDGLGNAV